LMQVLHLPEVRWQFPVTGPGTFCKPFISVNFQ
jgi:hypothetical protein